MRICVVAEHASYRFGGEAVLPLHYFAYLRARNLDVWLVAHTRTREELEALFPQDLGRFRFIRDGWEHKFLFRMSQFLPRRIAEATLGLLSQLITQSMARKVVRKLIAEEGVNVVHQPIPVSPKFPSMMHGLGVPVIIGPMNGGMEYPAAFRASESALTRVSIALGRQFSNVFNTLLPGKRQARILLVANERTRLALPSGVRGEVIEIPENGVDLRIWTRRSDTDADSRKPVFIFVGRLVDWKGVDMAIEALQQVPGATLEIIGDGPMRAPWQALAQRLNLQNRVRFSGFLTQTECAHRLEDAEALILPSIYECGGAVVLEAMAMQLPVIATRWGGPVDYITEDCGILIEPASREALVFGFANAMQALLASNERVANMGNAARQRVVEHFDWERKIDRILEIYRRALA